MQVLALSAILPAGATLYFFVFWHWFDHWRRHRVQTYSLMCGTLIALGAAVWFFRGVVFAHRVLPPWWVQVIGWAVVAIAGGFGMVADRQIGMRVRSFMPFFDEHGRIELKTTGAYGVVRHPIYAAGIGYQLGVCLVTGYIAVAIALPVLGLGALWFTRQEERRLVELLDDPEAYRRYRDRVPALFPWTRRQG
jgi:protein-S-isoprenylcysteine O-methyltransferase Ste14